MADGAAEARVNGGIVDEYFGDMKRRLKARLDKPKGVLSGNFVEDFATAYGIAAQKYVATGNPYREGESVGAAPEIDGDRPLSRLARQLPGSPADGAASLAARARSLRDFANGKFGQGLVAIVELCQGRDGHLIDAKLLEPSGSVQFDAHVMRVAPQALSLLGPPPPTVRIPDIGLRSHWAFEGHIVYMRRQRDVSILQDGWYLALAMGANMLTGEFDSFDDATYVDLRYPELKVRAKLLRIYR